MLAVFDRVLTVFDKRGDRSTYIVFVHEHVKLSNTNPQVSFIELIWNVPAQWTESSSFLDDGMEKAQTVQHFLELSLKCKIKRGFRIIAA